MSEKAYEVIWFMLMFMFLTVWIVLWLMAGGRILIEKFFQIREAHYKRMLEIEDTDKVKDIYGKGTPVH